MALYGHQNEHQRLREIATTTLLNNIDRFRGHFMDSSTTPQNQIQELSRPNVYAGQECVLALAMALDLNILVTIGGDNSNPAVTTISHSFDDNNRRIHLIWRRSGGGHYETVTENPTHSTNEQTNLEPITTNSNIKWTTKADNIQVTQFSDGTSHEYSRRPIDMNTISQTKSRQCPECKVTFKTKFSLKKHLSIHMKNPKEVNWKQQCLISDCDMKFRTTAQVIEHLTNAHGADIVTEDLLFETKTKFKDYVEMEEEKSNTKYVQRKEKKTNKQQNNVYQLVCHRSGTAKSHLKKGTELKGKTKNKKGHCQTGKLCPARMFVTELNNGTVTVKFVKSHTHSVGLQESKFMPVPDKVKDNIINLLSMKVPINNILDNIREQFSDRNSRDNMINIKHYNLIGKKTIHNLKRKLSDPTIQLHPDDATSTYLKVQALTKEKFNPILLYKQQDKVNSSIPLKKEDFICAFMTQQQLQMYQEHAGNILCMNSTHNTNVYSFLLITLLVPDEYDKGYPIAFCISNREDEEIIQLFLNSVKAKSPQTKINILMTDDDSSGYNAARAIYGQNIKHYLCVWHIHRAWIRNLHQYIKNDEHKGAIYWHLCSMMDAQTIDQYQQIRDTLRASLRNIYPNFLKYLDNTYFNRPEKWTMYSRKGDKCKVNTNMFIESFHNQLKTNWFNGKRNRRIDILIETLLKIENNLFINHFKQKTYSMHPKDNISIRHQRSLEIPDCKCKQINQDTYTVEGSDDHYTVQVIQHQCDSTCLKRCKEIPCVNLCQHKYTCSCPDYINGFLCKHIHKIHSLGNCLPSESTGNCSPSESSENVTIINPPPCITQRNNTGNIKQSIEELLFKIKDQINEPNVKKLRLKTVLAELRNIVAGNEAVMNINNNCDSFTVTERISGNANNEKQPRFRSTKKKSGRPKKTPIRKPTNEEKQQILIAR